jgi:excisionase family DNA binding protein
MNKKSDGPARLAYKINEVADILGVSPSSVRRAIERGLIRPIRAFRHVLVPARELERFTNGQQDQEPIRGGLIKRSGGG